MIYIKCYPSFWKYSGEIETVVWEFGELNCKAIDYMIDYELGDYAVVLIIKRFIRKSEYIIIKNLKIFRYKSEMFFTVLGFDMFTEMFSCFFKIFWKTFNKQISNVFNGFLKNNCSRIFFQNIVPNRYCNS